jgi:hypothetical protein
VHTVHFSGDPYIKYELVSSAVSKRFPGIEFDGHMSTIKNELHYAVLDENGSFVSVRNLVNPGIKPTPKSIYYEELYRNKVFMYVWNAHLQNNAVFLAQREALQRQLLPAFQLKIREDVKIKAIGNDVEFTIMLNERLPNIFSISKRRALFSASAHLTDIAGESGILVLTETVGTDKFLALNTCTEYKYVNKCCSMFYNPASTALSVTLRGPRWFSGKPRLETIEIALSVQQNKLALTENAMYLQNYIGFENLLPIDLFPNVSSPKI